MDSVRAFYLRSNKATDWQSEVFQQWVSQHKLRRLSGEVDLIFAFRVLSTIASLGQYSVGPSPVWKASEVSKSLVADCGGFSLLFVAAMRNSGIPARTLWGRWAVPGMVGNQRSWHVKAEFFAQGVGWVPVDPSLAVLSKNPVAYFGRDDGDFLVFHQGTDLHVEALKFGVQTIVSMQSPHSWDPDRGMLEDVNSPEV